MRAPIIQTIFQNVTIFNSFTEDDKTYSMNFTSDNLFEYLRLFLSKSLIARRYDKNTYQTVINDLRTMIDLHILTNEYKYKTLIKTIFQKYNPIENYAMLDEFSEVTKEGKRISESTQQGSLDVTTQNEVTSFENTSFRNDTKSTTTTTPTNDYKLKSEMTNDEKTITFNGENFDSGVNAHHTKTKRSGNIGVTTSQQMLESERKLAYIDIIKIFFDDISKFIFLTTY